MKSVDAFRALAAAKARAAELGCRVTIAVVDEAGHLKAYERMDGAEVAGVQLAPDKAFTALSNRIETHELGRQSQPGGPFFGIHTTWGGRMCIFAGGVPIRVGGEVVGAVGVSGGSAEEDLACAQAGAADGE